MLLYRNHYPLKSLPRLIWVGEYDFNTELKLEECYTNLAVAYNNRANKREVKIIEVVWDGNNIYFAAEMTRSYGRGSAWAGLAGKISISESDNQTSVHCYIGDNPSTIWVAIVMWLGLLLVVFNSHFNIPVGILLSALPCLLLINSFKRLMESILGDFKYEILQILNGKSGFNKYDLNFKL